MPTITSRERSAIINSLAAGVVPSIGLQHIQVGRADEVQAVLRDLEQAEQDSAAVRFIVGRYGSGKTFFLSLMRSVALQRKFVVAHADITTERRLQGHGGQARALYTELVRNLATRAKPEGGALANLVEKWIGEMDQRIRSAGGGEDEVKQAIFQALRPLQDLVSGFDFVAVLVRYYEGFLGHNQPQQDAALRWLRGEYTTKTEARQDLGVRTIIDDEAIYDYLKLWAVFTRIAGYAGLVVSIDELVVLSHRLNSAPARNNNYEAILRIVNDCLQGGVTRLVFLFAGTTECLEDRRRGLFSYDALATRLAGNAFAVDGRRDFSNPVIRLENLTPEDCYVLLENIRNVFAGGDASKHLLPDDGVHKFLEYCHQRMGAAYYQTPRDTVKSFVGFLSILEQHPNTDWQNLLTPDRVPSKAKMPPEMEKSASASADDLKEFKL